MATSGLAKGQKMKNLIFAAIVGIAALAAPTIVTAAEDTGLAYVTPMGSLVNADDDRQLSGNGGGRLIFGKAVSDRFSAELGLDILKFSGSPNADQVDVDISLLRVFAREDRFSPYLLGGLGYVNTRFGSGGDKSHAAIRLGAGFLFQLHESSGISLRTEYVRRIENASSSFNDAIVNVGLQIPIGKKEVPVVVRDSDGDGVPDDLDRCPGTPAGATVDANGCEIDSDGDGVVDSADRCPGTPAGVPVDAFGCTKDSDGDGVHDGIDQCPGTPAGVLVDVRGCEIKEEINLRGVNFEYNSADLTGESRPRLNQAAATLEKNPSIVVEVAGHTDSAGSENYNQSLSERRAASVKDYLVAAGIDAGRLTARGYGESRPVADNDTDAGRAENRRVVLRILER
jgi:OOP family OmpA-OmpF porin